MTVTSQQVCDILTKNHALQLMAKCKVHQCWHVYILSLAALTSYLVFALFDSRWS